MQSNYRYELFAANFLLSKEYVMIICNNLRGVTFSCRLREIADLQYVRVGVYVHHYLQTKCFIDSFRSGLK